LNLGLNKTYYNSSNTPGENDKSYIRFNLGYSRLFYESEKQDNIVKPGIEYGVRALSKLGTYFFAGVHYNYSLEKDPLILSDENLAASVLPGSRSWVGLSFGVKLH
jgi:hypothetical protein